MNRTPGSIALIGSGEMADAMAEVHRMLMARLDGPIKPVFVDTLAGFELNVDQIDQKASAYFKRNFDMELAIARYRSERDGPDMMARAIAAIQAANYIFAGPGSPSYGVRVLRDSPVWQAVIARWRAGATLVFASAAAVTLGCQAIPVYEIYKVGQDVCWMPGLDLLGEIGIRAAVIPHWNNNSGDQHDTRFCYMGAPRLALLEQQLEPDVQIIGIDEYTCLNVKSSERTASVLGVGQATIRQKGRQATYSRGQHVNLDDITFSPADSELPAEPVAGVDPGRPATMVETDDIGELRTAVEAALTRGDLRAAANDLLTLSVAVGIGLEQGLYDRADRATQALQAALPQLAKVRLADDVAPALERERDMLIELVVAARDLLRRSKQWPEADRLRQGLAELGYAISDMPEGAIWEKR